MDQSNHPGVSVSTEKEAGKNQPRHELRNFPWWWIGTSSGIRVAARISEEQHRAIARLGDALEGHQENNHHNDALRFVANSVRVPSLEHVRLSFSSEYSCSYAEDGDNLVPDGNALHGILSRETLRSATVEFDSTDADHTARLMVHDRGLTNLPPASLQSLTLRNCFFPSLAALAGVIAPLTGLVRLHLDCVIPEVPDSEYAGNNWHGAWKDPSRFLKALGSLTSLRALVLGGHRLTGDNDLFHLSSLKELRELGLVKDPAWGASLTDAAMNCIASNFCGLEVLDVRFNHAITIAGHRTVLRLCPSLVWIRGTEAGLEAGCLEKMVREHPSLDVIEYESSSDGCHSDRECLEAASRTSGGRCLFIGSNPSWPYQPAFDASLMANHHATRKRVEARKARTNLPL